MSTETLISLFALGCYTYAVTTLWPREASPESSPEGRARWLVVLAVAAHTYVCHSHLFGTDGVRLSLIYVANVTSLVMTLVVLLAAFRLPVSRLFLLLIPIGILTLASLLLIEPGVSPPSDLTRPLLAHIFISLAAYSALMLAACQSVLLAILDRRLKTPGKQTTNWLPPLETMEQLLVAMLWIGLTLLTASILSGFLFLEDMFAQNVAHHIVITSLSWFVYAFFLVGRYFFGWRGLTAVRWTLVAFALLVIGYLGSKFVLEYILQR